MVDWHSSMQQTYEFYKVDPLTWLDSEKMDNVLSCTIVRDSDEDTKGSASFTTSSTFEECYVRPYLVTIQNGESNRHPLGAYLCQTPNDSFDGKIHNISVDAYTPLIELSEKNPPVGYSINKGQNIMTLASALTRENARAPVVPGKSDKTISKDFIANLDDTWMGFLSDFISNARHSFNLDDRGRIIFEPWQEVNSLHPVWTFTDDNSSILYPEISVQRDLYGIPNVVEVIYSSGTGVLYSRVVNDDPDSPISTIARGREVVHRDTNPDLYGTPNQAQLDEYAKQKLRTLSSLEYTLTYSHGYCPVRVGDCVMLDYKRENLKVKAQVKRQSIKCEPGCPVEETAVYTQNLWE